MGGLNLFGGKKDIIASELMRKQLRTEIPDNTFALLSDARSEVVRERVQARRKSLRQLRTINLSLLSFLLLLYYLVVFLQPDMSYLRENTGYSIPLVFVVIVVLAVLVPRFLNGREHTEDHHPLTSVDRLKMYARLEIEEEEAKKTSFRRYADIGEALLLVILLSSDTAFLYFLIYGLPLMGTGI